MERPLHFPVTDDVEDAPDGAVVFVEEYNATYRRVGMQWEFEHVGRVRISGTDADTFYV